MEKIRSGEETIPKFTLDHPRHDPTTVFGRFQNMLEITDPRILQVKTDTIWKASQTIEAWKKGQPEARALSDEVLWKYRSYKESSVHPDTGEIIPRPFRMCGFTAFGTPIVLGMLLPMTANSVAMTAFFQWANQSHNAAVNWSNRSVTGGGDPTWDIAKGYSAAVVGAVGIGVGSNVLVDKLKVAASTKVFLKKFTPFPAVCAASVVNMVMMRMPELQRGINVYDVEKPDECLGTSKIAATEAIKSTAVVRVVLVACAVLVPQILYGTCEAVLRLKKPIMAPARIPVQLVCTVFGFGLGVPLSLSAFTQDMQIPRSTLEPELRGSNPDALVKFNKGL